ncbi:MAG TPA: DNA-3-methyladenine glycosylase 2 family protein [Candidatus Paceibacterota bacterium]
MEKRHINKAIRHLKKDEKISILINKFEKPDFGAKDAYFKSEINYFKVLTRFIIHQQISGKVARVIEDRFNALFKSEMTPKKLLALKIPNFKKSGISPQKINYLKDLAVKFMDGMVDPSNFHNMTDEEIRQHLVSVKGIGRWTADMFLMFTLYRPDVLPTGDLGIQKGFKKVFGMRTLPDAKKMEKLAEPWQPHRTVACMYLWKVADEDK